MIRSTSDHRGRDERAPALGKIDGPPVDCTEAGCILAAVAAVVVGGEAVDVADGVVAAVVEAVLAVVVEAAAVVVADVAAAAAAAAANAVPPWSVLAPNDSPDGNL